MGAGLLADGKWTGHFYDMDNGPRTIELEYAAEYTPALSALVQSVAPDTCSVTATSDGVRIDMAGPVCDMWLVIDRGVHGTDGVLCVSGRGAVVHRGCSLAGSTSNGSFELRYGGPCVEPAAAADEPADEPLAAATAADEPTAAAAAADEPAVLALLRTKRLTSVHALVKALVARKSQRAHIELAARMAAATAAAEPAAVAPTLDEPVADAPAPISDSAADAPADIAKVVEPDPVFVAENDATPVAKPGLTQAAARQAVVGEWHGKFVLNGLYGIEYPITMTFSFAEDDPSTIIVRGHGPCFDSLETISVEVSAAFGSPFIKISIGDNRLSWGGYINTTVTPNVWRGHRYHGEWAETHPDGTFCLARVSPPASTPLVEPPAAPAPPPIEPPTVPVPPAASPAAAPSIDRETAIAALLGDWVGHMIPGPLVSGASNVTATIRRDADTGVAVHATCSEFRSTTTFKTSVDVVDGVMMLTYTRMASFGRVWAYIGRVENGVWRGKRTNDDGVTYPDADASFSLTKVISHVDPPVVSAAPAPLPTPAPQPTKPINAVIDDKWVMRAVLGCSSDRACDWKVRLSSIGVCSVTALGYATDDELISTGVHRVVVCQLRAAAAAALVS